MDLNGLEGSGGSKPGAHSKSEAVGAPGLFA